MTYKFLDHTADVKFIAEGESLAKAFEESVNAMKETICGDEKILGQIKKEMTVKGNDLENLLYKFLEEFLVLLDSEEFVLSEIEKIEIDEDNFILKAKISGDNASNYKFTNDVKAVTYNEMKVEEDTKKQIWKITVVLDV